MPRLAHRGTKESSDETHAFKGYLAMELKDSWVPDEWTVLGGQQRSARQKDSSDCGVLTILNALVLRSATSSYLLIGVLSHGRDALQSTESGFTSEYILS